MNKKFSTLVAALLLSGTLVSVEAASVTPESIKTGIELVNNGATIKFTGDVDLKNDYLLIADDNVVIDGNYNQYTLKGRLVITGKNVTVKNLNIVLKNEASNYSVYKNAITILSSSVTLTGNKITCEESKAGYMANGISIFPTTTDAKFTINGNTIIGANSEVRQWQSAGILLSEDIVFSLGDGLNTTAVKLKDFDITSISNNTYENCAADYLYTTYDGQGTTFEAYQTICVTPVKDPKTGDYINVAYVKSLVEDSNEETVAIFNGTAEEFQKIVKENNITTTSNVVIECSDYNYLFEDAKNPDNGKPALVNGTVAAKSKIGDFELLKEPTSGYAMLIATDVNGLTWIASADEDGNAKLESVTAANISTFAHNKAYLWKTTSGVDSNGDVWYKFKNEKGVDLKSTSGAGTGEDGVFKPVGNAAYNDKGVVFELSEANLSGDKLTTYGLYKTADNYFVANQLIKRYGDYFTLGITYKNDKNKDVDVTGVFAGQLRPVVSVTYSNGQAKYTDATTQEEFMLVNAEGNIIVIDKNDPLFEAPSDHGYTFTTISPKQWVEWQKASNPKEDYETNFKLAYDYNNPSTTEAVTSIEIGGMAVGLEKKEGNIILVADVENQLLEDPTISIKLNAGNGITAQEWLTTPSYYKVEVINKDKNAPHYGKVLGLNEYGSVAWVAPENVDLNKPEGQFAINSDYTFVNRENQASANWILDGELYQVEKDVYAVVHPNWSEGNDTLRITPITTYKSSDGFKRFSASELNANTYTVAMKSLMGDPFIIENHNDKHRLGLSADEYTEWRIEMPTVKLMDATDDFTRMAADTVKVLTPITYWADNGWRTTQISDPEAKYYAPNTQLEICTYVLKNTDNGEYLNGVNDNESAGNEYYVCQPKYDIDEHYATRIAFKEDGEGTVNLAPAYEMTYDGWKNWNVYSEMSESNYDNYVGRLHLSYYKIEGGLSPISEAGVLKDENLYKATTNDLFVIEKAEAPTYKKLAQDDKIILTLKENAKDEYVLFEDGEFAGMGNRLAHKDINPTLYVDTAYVNRVDNYAYQYLLSVRPTRIDTTYQCNLPEEHGVHHADTTKGFFLVNMVDSALANQNVHKNKFVYDGEYKLAFVEGYHTNDSLFFTEEGKVVSKMEVGNADFNIAKYAFKMVDETENEFVVETAAGYAKKYNWVEDNNGHWHWTVASVESKPGYLRWVNDNLVVTEDIDKAAVVVKGAEGKNVIVSTILGKVVANEVLTSDNAQIAAPAGIVVVSVDGESFKVVVK